MYCTLAAVSVAKAHCEVSLRVGQRGYENPSPGLLSGLFVTALTDLSEPCQGTSFSER